MSQQEILRRVVEALEGSQTSYMLTGSLVSSLQGEPRATHDVDFVLFISRGSSGTLFAALSQVGGDVDYASIERAIENQSVFNLIDPDSGLKVDFWMLTDDPFDRSPWDRFLVAVRAPASNAPPIHVIVNWTALLEAR